MVARFLGEGDFVDLSTSAPARWRCATGPLGYRKLCHCIFHMNMGVWQKLIHVVTYTGAVPCTVGGWELIYVPVKTAHLSSDTSLNIKKRAD
jgi:hypothetical protein